MVGVTALVGNKWTSLYGIMLGSRIKDAVCVPFLLAIFWCLFSADAEPSETVSHRPFVSNSNNSAGVFLHCNDGWTLNQENCFKFVPALLTWQQAKRHCESQGGTLAHTHHVKDSTWLSLLVTRQFANQTATVEQGTRFARDSASISVWIGIMYLSNGSLSWPKHSGERRNAIGDFKDHLGRTKSTTSCFDLRKVRFNDTRFSWQTSPCDEKKPFVCMTEACDVTRVQCRHQNKCISRHKMCDGVADCRDGSDEKQCENGNSDTPSSMSSNSAPCGAIYTKMEGRFKFPGLLENYQPFSSCVWTIETNSSHLLAIMIENLDIEEIYDTLNIFDGVAPLESTLLASFNGSCQNEIVHSSGSFATIQFLSDESVQRNGFSISWHSVPLSGGCGKTINIDDVEIGSIKFDMSTQSHMAQTYGQTTCDWIIYSDSVQSHLTLQIKNLHLTSGDSFQVIDGFHFSDPVVYALNSTQRNTLTADEISLSHMWPPELLAKEAFVPVVIVSSFSSLVIRLITVKHTSSEFSASFQKGCDIVTSSPVLLQSPGMMTAQYPNNLNCSWKILEMQSHCQLTMLLSSKFYTEASKDILQIFKYNDEKANPIMDSELSGFGDKNLYSLTSYRGFYLSFQTDSTVNRGYWSSLVSCGCEMREIPDSVLLSTYETGFGVVVEYSCTEGYNLNGPTQATCGLNQHWNPREKPFCEEVTCEIPPEVSNGYLLSMSGRKYMDKAKYKCHNGFIPSSNAESTCGVNGWSNVLVCHEVHCIKQPPPSDGNARAEDTRFGYKREYFCDSGFKLVGSKFSHCNIDGKWSDEVPKCEAQRCPALENPLNGKWNFSETLVTGESVRIICDEGLKPNGSQILTCKDGLIYDQKIPTCIDIDECLNPDICSSHQCQNYNGGYNCFCSKGYHKLHNNDCMDMNECLQDNGGCSHMCLNLNGSYKCQCPKDLRLYQGLEIHIGNQTIIPMKSCIWDDCKPFTVRNGTVTYNQRPLSSGQFLNGTRAVVTCPTGMSPNGIANGICLAGEGWTLNLTDCVESKCKKPLKIWNGNVSLTNLKEGGMATYTCRRGFKLKGYGKRFCLSKSYEFSTRVPYFDWNGEKSSCEAVTCPNLTSPLHGEVFITKFGFKSVAVFKCICGFHLVGKSVIWCTENGNWDHSSPTCEVKSCRHPGIPKNAEIVRFSPGFSISSFVSYQCKRPGYQISDSTPIRCIPFASSKPSSMKPFLQVLIDMSFTTSEENSVSSSCNYAYENHISQSLVEWVGDVIKSECSDTDSNALVSTDIFMTSVEDEIRLNANVTISTMETALSLLCKNVIQSCLRLDLSTFVGLVNDITHFTVTCSQIHINLSKVKISSGQWQCWPGLTLEFSNKNNAPFCVEGCFYKNLGEIDPMSGLSTDGRASLLLMDQKGNRIMTPAGSFSYPTAFSSTITDFEESNPVLKDSTIFKTDNFGTLYTQPSKSFTDTTTKEPKVSLDNFSPQGTVPIDFKIDFSHSSLKKIAFTTPFPFHQQKDSTLNDDVFHATKDQVFFRNEDETFPSHRQDSFPQGRINPDCGRREINAHNLRSPSSGGDGRHMSPSSNPFTDPTNDSQSDCLTTHTLEKQETVVGHEILIPKVNMTAPFYNVEINDRMIGSFSNISCVDAVHVAVNAKVNEILRLFGQKIGLFVCKDTPDASLELLAGNIRFKETIARLFIKFTIANSVSSKSQVESCGREFESFIASQLPESLASVGPEISVNSCRFINYTSQDFRLSNTGWSCHSGYTLHTALFHCTFLSAFDKWNEQPENNTFVSVTSTPRLAVQFSGAFGLVHGHIRIAAVCVEEYKSGIISAMEEIETHLQSTFLQCTNIYIDFMRNISVSIYHKRVIAQVTVHLIPLKSSLSMNTITKCYKFLSLFFREPSDILPTVSLGRHYIPTCPEVILTPHSLRSKPNIVFFCPNDDIYDEQNFRCLDKSAPSFTTGVEISLQGNFKRRVCSERMHQLATEMAEDVQSEMRGKLKQGALCNGTSNPLLLEKEAFVKISPNNVTILLPVSLLILEKSWGESRSCKLDAVHYINLSLESPMATLLTKATEMCNVPLFRITQQHKVVYSRWECNPPLVYNYEKGICDELQNVQMKGLSSSRTKRQSGILNVQLRKVVRDSSWDKIIPNCHDIEPPIFHSCPEQPLIVVLDQVSPKAIFIPLPSTTDNSGIRPRIIFIEPTDFHLPYYFKENTTIIMQASDDSNNTAFCNISVLVKDPVPPVIICPAHVVHIREAPSRPLVQNAAHSYCHRFVKAYDNSNVLVVKFELYDDINTGFQRQVMVKAIAEDGHKNIASCHFFVIPELRCSESNLPDPINGFKRCVHSGRDRRSLVCAVTCQEGKAFSVEPPLQYVCAKRKNKWIPHNRVPDCYNSEFSNFELLSISHYNLGDAARPECLTKAFAAVETSIQMLINTMCQNARHHLEVLINNTDSMKNQSGSMLITNSIRVLLQTIQNTKPSAPPAQWCGNQLLPTFESTINDTLMRHCTSLAFRRQSNTVHQQNVCNKGFALIKSNCVECPIGTFWVNSECLECPKGRFQTRARQEMCEACPENFSTISAGAKSSAECLALCPVNTYSSIGLEPCIQCPVGTFQANKGSKYCEECMLNSGVPQSFCQDLCPVGYFSSTGKYPCSPCPLNHHTNQIAQQQCLPCSQGKKTMYQGADSIEKCIEFNPCERNPCLNRGKCKVIKNQISCECLPHYTGTFCNTSIDNCLSQPCFNNGLCKRTRDGFQCQCQPGFTGENCEHVIDHCLSGSCVHGVCNNLPDGYNCLCFIGFEGSKCHINKDDCVGITCQNGGICQDEIDDFHCQCNAGYGGKFCEESIDDCEPNQCVNGGTCLDGIDTFSCICPEGFHGTYCDQTTNNCLSNPCQNQAACLDYKTDFACICPVGFTGRQCEIEKDFCESQPCQNSGTCSNIYDQHNIRHFRCHCLKGFYGVRCQYREDACASMTCHVDGTMNCENHLSHHLCHCLPGWTGTLCDMRVDPCGENPCKNEGRCLSNGQILECKCNPGFSGVFCQKPSNSCLEMPCQNKGSCITTSPSSYPTCLCPLGFSGIRCEINIDECQNFPCLNGGTCQDGVNSFSCRCLHGFAGPTCEVDIDECIGWPCPNNRICKQVDGDYECLCPPDSTGRNCEFNPIVCHSKPCQNGGTCNSVEDGNFACNCIGGFTGKTCAERDEDECGRHINCLNGGTCYRQQETFACLCPPKFTGKQCEKEKSTDFDIQFRGNGSFCQVQSLPVGNATNVSLCLWVQFADVHTTGTFLSFISEGQHATIPLLVMNEIQIDLPFTGRLPTSVNINDGLWHHLCVLLKPRQWWIYQNGEMLFHGTNVATGLSLSTSFHLTLGQPVLEKEDIREFKGSITNLVLSKQVFEWQLIQQMSKDCSFQHNYSSILDWSEIMAFKTRNIVVEIPSKCKQDCQHGKKKEDLSKSGPKIIFCPKDMKIISMSSPVPITWNEPIFEDHDGVVAVQQNYRSGQAFSHGQYLVTYLALDMEDNSAMCKFHIFVSRFDCRDPDPPLNGARVCGEWGHGRYCIPSCLPKFMFITPVPPFYHCGRDGLWEPDGLQQQLFTFPMCARIHPPSFNVFGGIQFDGPTCNPTFVKSLQLRLVSILTQLDNIIGLCESENSCNYTQGLTVICGEKSNFRSKRDVKSLHMYNMDFNFSVSDQNSKEMEKHVEWIFEQVAITLKKDLYLDQFHLHSVNFQTEVTCIEGTALRKDEHGQERCVECPVDHFMDQTSACIPCYKGFYNDVPGAKFCKKCPTQESSVISLNCRGLCDVGQYFSSTDSLCKLCPRGQYQEETGQVHCNICPMGLTTVTTGCVNESACIDVCPDGEELGHNSCVECPLGWYRNQSISLICQPCPYGWTTLLKGTVSELQCSFKKCEPGQYMAVDDNTCNLCPRGTFQSIKGERFCIPCGIGLTTAFEGAHSKTQCYEGEVDECSFGIDHCSNDTECVDVKEGFICQCKFGVDKNGSCKRQQKISQRCKGKGHKLDGFVDNEECQCDSESCTFEGSSMLRHLIIPSLTVTGAVGCMIIVTAILLGYRWKKRMNRSPPVRLYRAENKLTAFNNDVFEKEASQVCSQDFDSASRVTISSNHFVRLTKHHLAYYDDDGNRQL